MPLYELVCPVRLNTKWPPSLDEPYELLRERRRVSSEMALRLARLFGNSPEFWLNAQRAVDLWDAARAIENDVARIRPLSATWREV